MSNLKDTRYSCDSKARTANDLQSRMKLQLSELQGDLEGIVASRCTSASLCFIDSTTYTLLNCGPASLSAYR